LRALAAAANLGVIVTVRAHARRACVAAATALAATALLAACSNAAQPAPSPSGAEPAAAAGRVGVPGVTGPPAIKVNPYAGTVGYSTRPRITVPPVPAAGSAAPVSLPIDAYVQTEVQQEDTLSTASAQVAQRCMTAAGFSFPIVPPSNNEALLNQFFEHQNAGLTSLALARTYGFQQPPSTAKLFSDKPQQQLPTYAAEQRKHGTAWASALVGEVPGMRPGTPPLGCARAANTLLFGNFNGSLTGGVPDSIEGGAIKWTDSDPHVLAAERTWSACMAGHGQTYTSVADLERGRTWTNPPTPAEVRVAVADVRCNQQANLANTYLTVEAAYQRALIGENQADLQQLQASYATLQQRAAQVLQLPAADILRFSHAKVHQVVYLLIPRVHGGHTGT
jgi:hypothetical protein